MKYLLIYNDKWCSFPMCEYKSYAEALVAMMDARRWHRRLGNGAIVRYEIKEVPNE